jgi:hypothetical protein
MRVRGEGADGWLVGLFGILLLLCTSQVAVALVNALVPRLATPRALPKMDLSKGIPPASQTLVVVPAIISSAQDVEHLIEALEVRYLGNRDDHLAFGLLTDLADAAGKPFRRTRRSSVSPSSGSTISTTSTAACRRAARSSSSTARGAGIPRSVSGWATSASAGSLPT